MMQMACGSDEMARKFRGYGVPRECSVEIFLSDGGSGSFFEGALLPPLQSRVCCVLFDRLARRKVFSK